MSIKKIRKPYLIIATIIIIGSGYYWYRKTHPSAQPVQYATAAAEKGTLTTSVTGSGNVIVDQSENIDPTITGTVANLSVAIGDQVKKGQFLFSIKNDSLDVSLAKSRASYLSSKKTNDSKSTHTKITQANFEAAKIDYENEKADAAKRIVTAPIAGTVNAVNIKNGDDLSKLASGSSRQVPMIIGDLDTLKAQVQINEVDVPNVQIGQKATMTFNSLADLTIAGQVEKIDSLGTIAQGVVTYNATINFDALDPRIKSGMSVSAAIVTGVKQGVIIVPNSAVKTKGTDNYVEVMKNGGTPQQAVVQVGASNNTETEIISGLSAGDKVVTRIINPNAATTTTAGQQGQGGGGGLGGGAFRALH